MLRLLAAAALTLLPFVASAARAHDEFSIAADLQIGRIDRAGRQLIDSHATGAHASFEAVAVSWTAVEGCTKVRVRASSDGQTWSSWRELSLDRDISDPSEGRNFSVIEHFGAPQRYLEYSTATLTGCSESLDRFTVTMFRPASETRSAKAVAQSYNVGRVAVRSRTDWGSPDGQGSRWTPSYSTVTHAIVHHTAGSNTVADWEAEVRNIWHFHAITRDWGDIGYNFLIDPNGVVYEGRAGGHGAIGAHFSCRNTNTVGVAMLGTFSAQLPTPAAMTSLKNLLSELTSLNAIPPEAVTQHKPSGLMLHGVSAHRDGNSPGATCTVTECPGNALYAQLPAIRAEITACQPARIDTAPGSRVVAAGTSLTLVVATSGSGTHRYQWYAGASSDDSKPLANETANSLTITATSTGSYWVRVTNDCGSIDSANAVITVILAGRRRGSRG